MSAEKLPSSWMGAYLGKGVIQFSGKPSTKTRLHELAHKELRHEPGRMTAQAFIDRELDAETWVLEKMDKKPTYRIGIPVVGDLVDRFGLSYTRALELVLERMESRGIRVTKQDKLFMLEVV